MNSSLLGVTAKKGREEERRLVTCHIGLSVGRSVGLSVACRAVLGQGWQSPQPSYFKKTIII